MTATQKTLPTPSKGGETRADHKNATLVDVMKLRRGGRLLGWVLVITYLAVVLGIPLFITVQGSLNLDPFWLAYSEQATDGSIWQLFARTLGLAFLATLLTALLGYPVAYAMTLVSPRLRAVLLVLLIFPQLTSFLVRTYAWIGILGVSGPVVALTKALGSTTTTYNYTEIGVLVVLVHLFLPMMILACYVTMSRIDPWHLRASRTLGASHLESFWSVYAPQTKPGLITGSVLVFISCAGIYATPALIGGEQQRTVVTEVVNQVLVQGVFGLSPAYPAALTVLLTAVVALVLLLANHWIGLSEILGLRSPKERIKSTPRKRTSEKPMLPRRRPFAAVVRKLPSGSGRRHVFVTLMVIIALLITDGPFVYLVGMSFQPLPLLAFPTGEWSTTWYSAVFEDPSWASALQQSVQIALLATLIALIVGSFLAMRSTKLRGFASSTVVAAALLPMIVPTIMYATGIYSLFSQLNLIGNWQAIAVAHSVLALPYVYVNVLNGLNSYNVRWDEAASSLGASPIRRLRKVTLPLLQSSLITGAFLGALISLDEFTATLFMGGLSFENLPLKFWADARQELTPELAVVGVLMVGSIILIAALAAAATQLTRRSNKKNRSES